jgi:hypothetical protein
MIRKISWYGRILIYCTRGHGLDCVLCVCVSAVDLRGMKACHSSSKYIAERLFCFSEADLAYVNHSNVKSSLGCGVVLRGRCFTASARPL